MKLRVASWWGLLALTVGLAIAVTGTGAAYCKFAADCHLLGPREAEDFVGSGGGAMEPPTGFRSDTVLSGLRLPTDFVFLPGGEILVAEKDGRVLLARDERLAARPVLDLTTRVNSAKFRGLVDVTVDPEFPRRPYIYVVYAARGAGRTSAKPTSVRVSRFTLNGDVVDPSTERVILGTAGGAGRSCLGLLETADCIPAEIDHVGADIVFAQDGTLFVSTGDGGGGKPPEDIAFLAQDRNSLAGKILRVDREGRGVPGNPYWNGDGTTNRSKVWATGLRNPFRMAVLPGESVTLAVGDVGEEDVEEINLVRRGGDYGWPCLEGANPSPPYRSLPRCESYLEAREDDARAPWVEIQHPVSTSITGGVATEAAEAWPQRWRRSYLFGDWAQSEIWQVPLDAAEPAPRLFARNAGGPVAFAIGPDGDVYYLATNLGELRRITSVG